MWARCCTLVLCTALLASLGDGRGGQPVSAQEIQEWGDEESAPGDVADVQVFYEALAPYGRWTTVTEYGQVWIPHGITAAWRPYTEGRWVYTRHGWTWIAEQPWGWAAFHYGRWAFVDYYGWVWIPGTVWGPAWVVWRHTPGWIGWAPLPPHVLFRPGLGLSGVYAERDLKPAWFCFVEERRLLAPRLMTYIAPPSRSVTLLPRTRNVTRYTVTQNRIVNHSVPVERIERATARPVPRMRIVTARTPESLPATRVRENAREVVLYQPGLYRSRRGPAVQPERPLQAPQSPPAVVLPEGHRRAREAEQQRLEDASRREPQTQGQRPTLRLHGSTQQTPPQAPPDSVRPPRTPPPALQQLQQRQELERQRPIRTPSPHLSLPSQPQAAPQLQQSPHEPPSLAAPQRRPPPAPTAGGVSPALPQARPMSPQIIPRPVPQQNVPPQVTLPPRATSPQNAPQLAVPQGSIPRGSAAPGRQGREEAKDWRRKQPSWPPQPSGIPQ